MEIKDTPKIKSPFVRETIDGYYIVTPKIDEEKQKMRCRP